MSTQTAASGHHDDPITEAVIGVIAEVTRYPRHILRPEAALEEDLGIESVKRAEILAVMGSRMGIAPPANEGVAHLQTVGDVVSAVRALLPASPLAPAAVPAPPPAAPAVVAASTPPAVAPAPVRVPPAAASSLAETVIDVIAEVTRYPRHILRPEAELEEELGIESVKRAEILAVLSDRLGVSARPDASLPPPRTIGDVIAAVETLRGGAGATAPAPAPHVPDGPAVLRPAVSAPAPAAPRAASSAVTTSKPLAGRVALVTGSGHGLGREIAFHLARQGAAVVVNSFHSREKGDQTAAELVAEGHRATHVWGSVAKPDHLDRLFTSVQEQFQHLDYLVSCASNARPGPIAEITGEDWERAFRTEVVALHQAALKAVPLMEKRGGGRIVAVTHPAAQRVFPGMACVGATKAAVESLVRYLAVALGPKGIQVNAVSAGPLGEHMATLPDAERVAAQWQARLPGQRLPDAAAVAEAIAFLLAADSRVFNGSTLMVDGGLSLAV